MQEVASASELAKLMLMEVSTHFFAESGLVEGQLLITMSEEAVFSVVAVAVVSKALTKLYFFFANILRNEFSTDDFEAHMAGPINYYLR